MHALVWLFAITLGGLWVVPPEAVPVASRPLAVAPVVQSVAALAVAPVTPSVAVLVPAPVGAFRWPLDGAPRVVRRFDPPPEPWLPGHRGVDLAASPGALVRAAGAGTVHFAGQIAGRGVVSVTHPNGLRTTYEPLEPNVSTGQTIAAGAQIGALASGHPGCPAAACLHWGLRRGDEYLDPLALLGLGRVRLLPLDAPATAVAVVLDTSRLSGARAGHPATRAADCSVGVTR